MATEFLIANRNDHDLTELVVVDFFARSQKAAKPEGNQDV